MRGDPGEGELCRCDALLGGNGFELLDDLENVSEVYALRRVRGVGHGGTNLEVTLKVLLDEARVHASPVVRGEVLR